MQTLCLLAFSYRLNHHDWNLTAFIHRFTENGIEQEPDNQELTQFGDATAAGTEKKQKKKVKQPSCRKNKVRAALLNVRSIGNKLEDVKKLIKNNDLDVFLVTETWIKSNNPIEEALSEFEVYHNPREDRRGGGVAVLVLKSLIIEDRDAPLQFQADAFEYVAVKLKRVQWSQAALLINVYRPPGGTFRDFKVDFEKLLDEAFTKFEQVILTGDLNGKWKTFPKYLHEKGLEQHVEEPTHDKGNTLDMIITKINQFKISEPEVKDDALSDHYTVYFNIREGNAEEKRTWLQRKAKKKNTANRT